ncbi:MAG: porin family protein [Steroidobacteraceae bacterium]|nr:porin family protein [Steroidobacteraceae bacterium]
MLRRTAAASGIAALGTMALVCGAPAKAEVKAGTNEVHVFAGYLFGDDLTETPISGTTPELDDDFLVGLRYDYNFTDVLGLDASLGFSPNSAKGVPGGGDVDLDITMLDVDAIWTFLPDAQFAPYLLGGVGYASANLDTPIVGVVDGQPVQIDDDNGFTLNAGIGARWFFTERGLMRLEARYRFMDKLVDNFDDSLNTFEATVSVGMTF